MRYERLPNGNIKVVSDSDIKELLLCLAREDRRKGTTVIRSDRVMYEVFESLIANSELQWVEPRHIGALSDAPILGIYGDPRPVCLHEDTRDFLLAGHYPDDEGTHRTWVQDVLEAWYFDNYVYDSPQEKLLRDDYAIFTNVKDMSTK